MSDNIKNDVSKLKYTSRDYSSIFNDLIESIPILTTKWTSREESDPGIVLIKLMSMLGDMLSYNQDKKALEVYPGSVTERKNAQQIFQLIGYNMHWYQSAVCSATFLNSSASPITIPRYTKILTLDGKICYTNIDQLEIPGGGDGINSTVEVSLIQGTPRTPIKSSQYAVPDPNQSWHSIYGYNMFSRDIIDNKFYLSDTDVDESTICIVDSSGEEWHQVDNVDLQVLAGKFFEFKVDEYDKPYVRLISYWQKYDIIDFKLFYIISNGSKGSITDNMLSKLDSNVYTTDILTNVTQNASDFISISNKASTYGYDPETPTEARKNSRDYVNTLETLITLKDFENATNRIDGVAKCIALDCTNDPDPNMELYTVKIYIDRESEYADTNIDAFTEQVKTELDGHKMMPLSLDINLTDINRYYWTVKGEVYLNEPVDIDTSKSLLVAINNQLRYSYGNSKVMFNQSIRYIDVVNTIMSVDPIINYVDMEQIQYFDNEGNEVPTSYITGKYTQEVQCDPESLVYNIKLSNSPIKPGSLLIKIDNGNYVIMDNGSGRLIDYQGLLQDRGSTINYNTGEILLKINITTEQNLIVSYSKNIISTASYVNINTSLFSITNDSLLKL